MHQLSPPDILDQLRLEERHFACAPDAFFQAWKRVPKSPTPNGSAMAPANAFNAPAASGTCAPTCCGSTAAWICNGARSSPICY